MGEQHVGCDGCEQRQTVVAAVASGWRACNGCDKGFCPACAAGRRRQSEPRVRGEEGGEHKSMDK
eukprot:gene36857-48396_t